MKSVEEVVSLFKQRERDSEQWREAAIKVRDAYNGDIAVPLPELSREEAVSVANLTQQGCDQLGMRVSSVMPEIIVPPARAGIKDSEKKAKTKQKVLYGWWQHNRMNVKLRRRARWLIAYGASPVVLRPDFKKGVPRWDIRDPLTTYPAPAIDPDDVHPPDCLFGYKRSLSWGRANFPNEFMALNKGRDPHDSDKFQIIEFVDDEEMILVAMGKDSPMQGTPAEKLIRVENTTGICPAVVPGRITLDRPMGQFEGSLGMFQEQARLWALHRHALERGIFPETWLVGRPNENPEIIVQPDPRNGVVGEVVGGLIQEIAVNPGFQTPVGIDRLERAQRLTSGIPAEFGGECVDVETEILTAEGWRTYDQVSVGTEVLTLNHDTGMSEWKPIERMNVFPGSHRVIEAHGVRHSSLSTLKHRWPVIRWDGSRTWRNSAELTTHDRIPIAAVSADLPTEAKWSDALVEAVAWFYTEGSYRRSEGQLSQSNKNAENVERIRACLRGLFGESSTAWRYLSGAGQGGVGHDGIPRWNESPPDQKGVIKFNLSKHAVDALLDHTPSKVPSSTFLRSLTAAQLELFLHVSMLADNCGEARFGQKDIARTEAFAFAAILAGRAVSFQRRDRTDSRPEWPDHTVHIARLRKRRFVKPKENAIRGSASFRETQADLVWCPTTPNGTWFARRHGTCYFTGNSGSNIRTGRRGENVLSAVVDFPVQEAQQLFELSLEIENKIAIAIAKKYFGNTAKSFYVSWKGAKGKVDYIPNETFDSDEHKVSYSYAGADTNGLVIEGLQRVGAGTLSKKTWMGIDPFVDDANKEMDQVTYEALNQALLSGIQQQAADPMSPLPIVDLAQLMLDVQQDKYDLPQGVVKMQERMQKRQAQQVQPGSPEAMPGASLPGPGTGAEAGAAIQEQPPSAQNLARMMMLTRAPNMTLPAER